MTDTSYLYQYFLDKSIDNKKTNVDIKEKEDIEKPVLKGKQEETKHE